MRDVTNVTVTRGEKKITRVNKNRGEKIIKTGGTSKSLRKTCRHIGKSAKAQ